MAYAATELPDGSRTYLHVFKPQRSDVLVLPFAADGRKFSSARILDGKNRIPVRLKKTDAGYLLRVDSPKAWDDIDTIIELK